jgi:hypothetical protein
VLALTSIDTAGLWVDRTIGAESDMSNLVASLAAVHTLSKIVRNLGHKTLLTDKLILGQNNI